MSRRRNRTRQKQRKLRNASKPAKLFRPRSPEEPVNWSRLHQRYASMGGRSVALGYVSVGPTVPAGNPGELAAMTGAAIIEVTEKQVPS